MKKTMKWLAVGTTAATMCAMSSLSVAAFSRKDLSSWANGMPGAFAALDQYQQTLQTVERQMDAVEIGEMIFSVFFVTLLALAVYLLVSMFHWSRTTMGKKELPPVATAPIAPAPAAQHAVCPKCGRTFEGGNFCETCGTAKVARHTYTLPIEGKITAFRCEELVNRWFAEHPYATDCTIKLETKQSLIIPFISRKFWVKNAVISYRVAEQPQPRQYGLAFLYKFRVFGPIGYSGQKQVSQWLESNPGCRVVSTHGGRIQHWDNKGGIYAQYYNYVLFSKSL